MDGAFPSQKGQSFDNIPGGRDDGGREGGYGGSGAGRGAGFRGTAENAKTRLCTRWLQGSCKFGDRCNFAHGEHELRQLPPRDGPRDFGRGRGYGGYGGRGPAGPAPGRGYGGRGPGGYDGGYGGGYGGPPPQYGYGMDQMQGNAGYPQMMPGQNMRGPGPMQGEPYGAPPQNYPEQGPNGWIMYRTKEGEPYFHNHQTNVTTWDRPADWPAPHM